MRPIFTYGNPSVDMKWIHVLSIFRQHQNRASCTLLTFLYERYVSKIKQWLTETHFHWIRNYTTLGLTRSCIWGTHGSTWTKRFCRCWIRFQTETSASNGVELEDVEVFAGSGFIGIVGTPHSAEETSHFQTGGATRCFGCTTTAAAAAAGVPLPTNKRACVWVRVRGKEEHDIRIGQISNNRVLSKFLKFDKQEGRSQSFIKVSISVKCWLHQIRHDQLKNIGWTGRGWVEKTLTFRTSKKTLESDEKEERATTWWSWSFFSGCSVCGRGCEPAPD